MTYIKWINKGLTHVSDGLQLQQDVSDLVAQISETFAEFEKEHRAALAQLQQLESDLTEATPEEPLPRLAQVLSCSPASDYNVMDDGSLH